MQAHYEPTTMLCLPIIQVCECVVILRGLKDVSWAGAKSMMADGNFLRSLVEFDKDSLSEKQVKKVKEYMKDPNFTIEGLKAISTAGVYGLKRCITPCWQCIGYWLPA